MRPKDLKTKIFSDSGDPEETKELITLLGFLDGQTTNPSLIAKNPEAKKRIESRNKFSRDELNEFYKKVVQDASKLIPDGSISIEVYADSRTAPDEMFTQGKEFFSWIPNAHIKYPTTLAGLEAAEKSIKEGMRVNMTLVFSQEQAAAVHAATEGAKKGDVFLSPFIGRLDDIGLNGMNLIENVLKMYRGSRSHVEVLTASVRNMNHFDYALALGSDIITAPMKILKEWAGDSMRIPSSDLTYSPEGLKPIEYENMDLSKGWKDFNVGHKLTEKGIEKFASDWNSLIK